MDFGKSGFCEIKVIDDVLNVSECQLKAPLSIFWFSEKVIIRIVVKRVRIPSDEKFVPIWNFVTKFMKSVFFTFQSVVAFQMLKLVAFDKHV